MGQKSKIAKIETRGGKRTGAGRPKGQGKYGEPTERIRVPISMLEDVKVFAASRGYKIPLYSNRVQAGLPSTASDDIEEYVNLNSLLVRHSDDAFLVPATGDSMIDAGISEGDLLLVDCKLEPTHGKIVVAAVDGQTTVKYLHIRNGEGVLVPANQDFPEMPINENGAVILGVVTSAIKRFEG